MGERPTRRSREYASNPLETRTKPARPRQVVSTSMDTGGDIASEGASEVFVTVEAAATSAAVAAPAAVRVEGETKSPRDKPLAVDTARLQDCGGMGKASPETLVAHGDGDSANISPSLRPGATPDTPGAFAASCCTQPAVLVEETTAPKSSKENCSGNEFVSKVHAKAGPFGAVLLYFDYVRWLWIATDKERLEREQGGAERIQVGVCTAWMAGSKCVIGWYTGKRGS